MNKRKRTSPIWTLTKEEMLNLVETSKTMSEVLAFFGLENKGGNHRTLKKRLQEDGIDYSKFKDNFGRGPIAPRIPINEMLVENSSTSRGAVKARLINTGLLINQCSECGVGCEWNGKPLVMVLDHINGVSNDNRLENLRLLCPNCNSQTTTFAGRSQKKVKTCGCGRQIHSKSMQCLICTRRKYRKVERPTAEELREMLWEKPTSQIAKQFGVSDKAVEKWAKAYNLSKPPRGYWV